MLNIIPNTGFPTYLRPHELEQRAAQLEQRNVGYPNSEYPDIKYQDVKTCLNLYDTVGLAEVSNSLLTRTDTKFLLSLGTLLDLLPALEQDYAVLEIDDHRLFDYHNLYLDSEDFAFFRAHHRGVYARHKLRYRYYQQTNDTFLELKTKDATRQTVKRRERLSRVSAEGRVEGYSERHSEVLEVVRKKIAAPQLVPQLSGHYKRISLVAKRSEERLTLDFDLRFASVDEAHERTHFGNVVVAELKQPRRAPQSPFTQQAKRYALQETSISKYCVGCCWLYPQLKHNLFKPVLRKLDKLG